MAKSNTIGTILGSVFITLLLVGAGGYFALPALYPNLKGDYATKEDLNDLTDQGILLQTKSNKSQTAANIFWNVFTYEKIVDTGLNITTNKGININTIDVIDVVTNATVPYIKNAISFIRGFNLFIW